MAPTDRGNREAIDRMTITINSARLIEDGAAVAVASERWHAATFPCHLAARQRAGRGDPVQGQRSAADHACSRFRTTRASYPNRHRRHLIDGDLCP